MKKIFLIIFLLFITSCVSAPQKIITPQFSPDQYTELGQTSGRACGFIFYQLIPIRFGSISTRAYESAIQQKGADDLINPSISESWYYCGVGELYCTQITGTAIKRK